MEGSRYDPETEWSSPGGVTGLEDCLLDCLDLSSEYHTLDVANRIGAAVYVRKQKDHRKHRKRPKAKRSQWRVKVKGLVADGEKNHILAQQAETLLHSTRLRFPDLPQTPLDMSKIQYNKQCLPMAGTTNEHFQLLMIK